MLCAERQDRDRGSRATDLPTEGVHRPNGRAGLHRGQWDATDGHSSDGDAVDDVHEVGVVVVGAGKGAKERAPGEPDVVERSQRVHDRIWAFTEGKQP